ncbi:alpha-isopropylmalate synthase regulatory domain-containing protein [Mycolicibacterium arenosum]|uniref:Homocitrate synthase n=1 Tax=Mycolicibacterium arenosum TaxID=2952157 RepID=A0ABT1M783_9MYCO|nr:alpha-isopropylmalate synthase regulatory domain-containing protein [Mycolicibacterium sp. CAU 1645]MCP9274410.1 homocitrate synthase [Mycolicibacterium sp. CAU 1645]
MTAPPQPQSRFAELFDAPLPRGLREEVAEMDWTRVIASHSPAGGPVRLRQWECTDAQRPASRLGPQARNYRATIAVGDSISTCTAAGSGPVAALTVMLHARGVPVELLRFHQLDSAAGITTFVRGTDGAHAEWGMGVSDDATESALSAVVACANRLAC